MKQLSDFVKESIVNESNPRGNFKVIKPFPTDFMWEYYESYKSRENEDYEEEYDEMRPLVDEAEFEKFLEFAKKKRWKKTKDGYFIIPKGTTLTWEDYLYSASHVGKWEIDGAGVYITMTYDEIKYDEHDKYLESTDEYDDDDDY